MAKDGYIACFTGSVNLGRAGTLGAGWTADGSTRTVWVAAFPSDAKGIAKRRRMHVENADCVKAYRVKDRDRDLKTLMDSIPDEDYYTAGLCNQSAVFGLLRRVGREATAEFQKLLAES